MNAEERESAVRDLATSGDEQELAEMILDLREGLSEVRLRHMYNCHEAGEAIAVWVLNGNKPSEWNPGSSNYGYRSEQEYQERRKLNKRLAELPPEPTKKAKPTYS